MLYEWYHCLLFSCTNVKSLPNGCKHVNETLPSIYLLSSHLLSGYITNSHNDQLPVGLVAQLVEHCTSQRSWVRIPFKPEFEFVESTLLHDVERSLISIKHRLHHRPTCEQGVNNNVAFNWPPCSTSLDARMSTKLTLQVSVSMAMICCFYYSTIVSFHQIRSRERAKYIEDITRWREDMNFIFEW